ncbi:MAG TPA: porin family protein [Cyclobacteriaceae bacterium]|nr:porin family protein [Cyclobacteriaceae bacterium]
MKKIIILSILAITCIATRSHAQENNDYRKQLMFGLKAGANYSNVYDAQGEAFVAKAKYGFAGGVFLSIPIGRYFGIQPEVLYSQKGFNGKGTLLGSSYDLSRTTSFIDVPLLVAIKPARFLTLLAGPQFSYLLTQKDVFTNSSTTIQQEQAFKNDNIRKNILCFVGGLDFNFNHLVLGARAGWDLRNNNGSDTSTTPRYKNAWLQATVGVRF